MFVCNGQAVRTAMPEEDGVLGWIDTGPSWEGDDPHVDVVLKKTGLAGGKPVGRPGGRRNGTYETDALEGAAMLEAASTHTVRHVHCSNICRWIRLTWLLSATERKNDGRMRTGARSSLL